MSVKLSNASSIIMVIVSTLGTGILYMPSSFKILGYFYALPLLAFVALLTYFTLYSLSYTAIMLECREAASYSRLASIFSKNLKVLIDITMLCSSISSCVVITRNFAFTAASLIKGRLGIEALSSEQLRITMLSLFLAVAAVCFMMKNLSSLAFISKISISAVIYYLLLVSFYAFSYGNKLADLTAADSSNAGAGFMKFIFALHCQFSFLSIFNEMADNSLGSVSMVCAASSFLIFLIYSCSGLLGYMAIGNAIGKHHALEIFQDKESDFMEFIMSNTFDKNGILPTITVLAFLFVWFGFVACSGLPIVSIIQTYMSPKSGKWGRPALALCLAGLLFAVGFPEKLEIDTILNLATALFTNPLSFIYPSVFMINVSPRMSAKSLLSYALIAFSFGLMFYILTTTFFQSKSE